MEKGLIQVYTGDGKGKSTAAFGQAIRAAGRDLKVVIYQFLKAVETGEVMLIRDKLPEIKVLRSTALKKFTWNMNEIELEHLKQDTVEGYAAVKDIIKHNECDLLILDEIMYGLHQGFIDLDEFIEVISSKPETMEIVITGRDAPQQLIDIADYVTEMKKIKHPFDEGIALRIGIEQ